MPRVEPREVTAQIVPKVDESVVDRIFDLRSGSLELLKFFIGETLGSLFEILQEKVPIGFVEDLLDDRA